MNFPLVGWIIILVAALTVVVVLVVVAREEHIHETHFTPPNESEKAAESSEGA